MIRSLATTATSSRGGSKNGNRIGRPVGNTVRKSSTSLRLGSRPAHRLTERDNGGGENSRSIPTMTHTIRQVYAHPLSDFSQAIADSEVSSAGQGLTPLHVISGGCP